MLVAEEVWGCKHSPVGRGTVAGVILGHGWLCKEPVCSIDMRSLS